MLRLLSKSRKLCSGITRRDLLQAGSLGMLGLGLNQKLAAEHPVPGTSDQSANFGRAKRCIVLYLYGSPSQLETVDMKPEAPDEIRGTMNPVSSSLPGLDVCEHLPEMAKMMDRVTVVRSLTHPYPLHGVAFAMTGVPAIDVAMELSPHDPRHHPYFTSAAQAAMERDGRLGETGIAANVALPFPFSTQRVGEVHRAGPYAAYLGGAYNPLWTEFVGNSTRSVYKTLQDRKVDCHDPYLGCTKESYFRIASTEPPVELTLDRMNRRRSLLDQFDRVREDLAETISGGSLSHFQKTAFSLLENPEMVRALDVRSELSSTRDLYGHTLFGQACLAGRRLLESGTSLVSVFWDEYGLAGDAWDTHWNHYPRMTDQLLPGFDRAFSGLVLDLEERGMLEDTLIVCLSEHGRTPKLNQAKGGGRDHWSRAYSGLFAGGGIASGKVIGATDKHAADVKDRPLSPKSMLATMYHLLGIDPHSTFVDRSGQHVPLVPRSAEVVPEMLA